MCIRDRLKKEHDVLITLEDGILDGGFGEKIARFYGCLLYTSMSFRRAGFWKFFVK